MTDIARLGFSVDTSGLARAERAIDSLWRSARGFRDINLSVTTSGIESALKQLDRLSGRNLSARLDIDVTGAEAAIRQLERLETLSRGIRFDIDVASIDRAERALRELNEAASRAGGGLGGVRVAGQSANGSLKSLSGVAAAFVAIISGNEIVQGVGNVIKYNAEINLLSQSLQVSRDALQSWGIVGKRVGVDIADVFKDVNEKIGDFAATGGGEGADVFKRLKLDVNDLINLSPDQQLLKISDAIGKIKDISQGEKIFLLESLANDASKLLPYLESNAQKLREIDSISRESGAIIGDDQNAILQEASANLNNIQLALQGAGNAAAVVGAELVNAFAGGALDTALELDDLIYTLSNDVVMMGDSWSTALADMAAQNGDFNDDASQLFDAIAEYARIGFTYMPVWANAAYTAINAEGQALGAEISALWNSMQAVAINAFASLVQTGGNAFGQLGNIAGSAIGYIIGRLASLAGAISTAAGVLNSIPGFENVGAGAAAVEVRLNAMAAAAKSAGEGIKASANEMAASIRASAKEDENAARVANSKAVASRLAAQSALADAQAYQRNAESQRTLNIEMGKAERQFSALESSIDSNGLASVRARVNHEAVNKAMTAGAGAAGKKAVADNVAEKAVRDHASEVKRLEKAQESEIEKLEDGYRKLTMNEQAYYASTLASKEFSAAIRAEAESLNYRNTVEGERKKLEQDARKLLPETAMYRLELNDKGITGADAAALASQKIGIDADTIAQQNQSKIDELTMTADAYRSAELARDGFTRAQIDGIVSQEQEIKMLELARQSGGWAGYLQDMTKSAAQSNKTLFEINKAAAIANALINTREAVTSAYKFGSRFGGPALGAAFAGVALAAQMAQVKAISSQSFNAGGSASASGSSGASASSAGSGASSAGGGATTYAEPKQLTTVNITLDDNSLLSGKSVRNLIEKINEALGDGAVLRMT